MLQLTFSLLNMICLGITDKTKDFLLFLFTTKFHFKGRLAMSSVNKREVERKEGDDS